LSSGSLANLANIAICGALASVPLVGGVEARRCGRAGITSVVDSETVECHIRPPSEVVKAFYTGPKEHYSPQRGGAFAAIRDEPAVTRYGVPIRLNMNGRTCSICRISAIGRGMIGLCRNNWQFMVGTKMPRLGRSDRFYEQVSLPLAKGRCVPTLDLGGDKIPTMGADAGENPALGWRAAHSRSIALPVSLRYQFALVIRRANCRNLRLLLPMVSEWRI